MLTWLPMRQNQVCLVYFSMAATRVASLVIESHSSGTVSLSGGEAIVDANAWISLRTTSIPRSGAEDERRKSQMGAERAARRGGVGGRRNLRFGGRTIGATGDRARGRSRFEMETGAARSGGRGRATVAGRTVGSVELEDHLREV